MTPDKNSRVYYTVGHASRSVDELIGLLDQAGVTFVVDVRRIPRSRTNPQFNADTLPSRLAEHDIGYRHVPRLGGLRRSNSPPSSANAHWQNTSFRGYADYSGTAEFREGLAELCAIGRTHVCAVMCAEAVWWRCHRRIIADYLLADGNEVFHVMGPGRIERAVMNIAAVRQEDGTLIYPAPEEERRSGSAGP